MQVLRRQVRWSGIPIPLRIFQFVVIHTVKGFSIVNEAEVFSEIPLLFFMIQRMLAIWSLGPLPFSKFSLYIWKFSVHVLLQPSLQDLEHDLASMRNECNCAVVWLFFGIGLLWYWNENWPFPSLWPLLSFPYLSAYWVQHFNSFILSGDPHIL